MKRKILSILFVLVLVLSLSLVMAVPVMAQHGKICMVDPDYTGVQGAEIDGMQWYTTMSDIGLLDSAFDGATIHLAPGEHPGKSGKWYLKWPYKLGATNVEIIGAGADKTVVWGKLWDVGTGTTVRGVTFKGDLNTRPTDPVDYNLGRGATFPTDIAGPVSFDHVIFDGFLYGDITDLPDGSTIDHCDFVSDYASGFAVSFHEPKHVTVTNSIFDEPRGVLLDLNEGTPTEIRNNVFHGGTSVPSNNENNITGNLYIDPQLNADYSLPDSSPLLTAGIDGTYMGAIAPPPPPEEVWVADTGNDSNPGTEAEPFATIQKGVNTVASGGTVNVAAGTYDEQVVINKSLTLQGAGDTTIVKPSSNGKLTTIVGGQNPYGVTKQIAGIIVANDASSVTIKNLKVDGETVTACPAGADYVTGIFYRETGGTIDAVTVDNMMVDGTSATKGLGIYLSSVTNAVSVEVKDSTITNFDKNGLDACGSELTANIHNNIVTGRGAVGDEVQNGIVVAQGTEGTVNHNTISGIYYTGAPWMAMAITFHLSHGSADNNTITDSGVGIFAENADLSAEGNSVTGIGMIGLHAQNRHELTGQYTVSFVNNTVVGSQFWGIGVGTQTKEHPEMSLTVILDGNHLTAGAGDGIYIGDSYTDAVGQIIVTIENNDIRDWAHGISIRDCNDTLDTVSATITGNTIQNNTGAGSGIHIKSDIDATKVQVHFNNIVGNTGTGVYGVYNGGTGTLDAENNWWGDASGPDDDAVVINGSGDKISQNVDADPWITGDVELGAVDSADVTGSDPGEVDLWDDEGNTITTVDISDAPSDASGTITAARYTGEPEPDGTSLAVGTGKTGVVFLDVQVTGYTSGMAHITVPYPDTDNDGTVDGTTIDETTLGLYYWDTATSMWRLATNNAVDTGANIVSGDIPVSALGGTPIGGGGYPSDEATVAIGDVSVGYSGNDTVALTITTKTAQLGAATIDLTFDPAVVQVLGGENSQFDSLTVNPHYGPQTARFVANQLGPAGVDATGGAVLAQVRVKAVGTTGSSSPLILAIITLKDNDGVSIPIGIVTPGTATIGELGDANSDGAVDVYDCVYIARAIAGIPGYSVTTAIGDVSGDGTVDAWDCTYLARHLAGIPGYELGG